MLTAHAFLSTCQLRAKVDDVGKSDLPASWKQEDVSEILSWEPWKYRSIRHQRAGNCSEEICKILNNNRDTQFCVSPKGLRDSLKILERDWQGRKRETDKGSGISKQYRELDQIMEDYLERRDEEETKHTKESAEDRDKEDKDKATGEEMRERAIERIAQAMKRNGKDEPRKKRQKSSDTLNYLREAAERESKLRQEELEKRKQEEATMANKQALLSQLRDQQHVQMQQQQQQQQQFMQMMQMMPMMLNSQQAQSQAITELLRKTQ
ncbi:trichohyalin-like [Stylophora pistillata]|uniref:Uncharacterized protein n=1 Tax=Stylophora pistillata TaxID=50429 RepID=A0A2B4R453_STYPI|nr:trichohyalin-like [Stylophora pistillata]PFX13114.1 hypothetical protein AWC38_SpisGene22831 [Stylophora pistillata]